MIMPEAYKRATNILQLYSIVQIIYVIKKIILIIMLMIINYNYFYSIIPIFHSLFIHIYSI